MKSTDNVVNDEIDISNPKSTSGNFSLPFRVGQDIPNVRIECISSGANVKEPKNCTIRNAY